MLLLFLSLFSCRPGGNGGLDAGIVDNPATATGKNDKTGMPEIVFKETEHDFSKVFEGETVSFSFIFTNEGESDLLLSSVSTSCGCTVTNYSREPVPPGKQGAVQVMFNSEGRRGFQQKSVTVVSNARTNKQVLTIKAMVMPAGQQE